MDYKLQKLNDELIGIIRLSDNTYIPMDEANTDYQKYLAWTKASPKNVAVEAD